MPKIAGRDYNLKNLDERAFYKYRLHILKDDDVVNDIEYVRRASTVSSLKFLGSLMGVNLEFKDEDAMDVLFDLEPFILPKENKKEKFNLMSPTGQEEYKKWRDENANARNSRSD